jgi:hypothetical protein
VPQPDGVFEDLAGVAESLVDRRRPQPAVLHRLPVQFPVGVREGGERLAGEQRLHLAGGLVPGDQGRDGVVHGLLGREPSVEELADGQPALRLDQPHRGQLLAELVPDRR